MSNWTADRGEVYHNGHHRMACWVQGDSLMPDHTLAEFVAELLGEFEDYEASFVPKSLLEAGDEATSPAPPQLPFDLRSPVTGDGDLLEWVQKMSGRN